MKDLNNAFLQIPPAEAADGTGLTYLLVWKFNNDVWFVSARVDPSGTFTYWAGRPQSNNFTATGGPKYAIYDAGSNATAETGSVDTSNGTITVDVPVAGARASTLDGHGRWNWIRARVALAGI